MREVDPFDYWESHASALEGLGGLERSPDPRYCFHTRYHEVRPGRAGFVLRLEGVHATFGEIAVRVHAWKPESDSNISLVSGARMLLQSDPEESALTLPVRFASQKGVLYALYGYLSEDSDAKVGKLHVLVDEPEDTGEIHPEPPLSILAMDQAASEVRPANALLHYGRPAPHVPVSQSCTHDQIAALGLTGHDADSGLALWGEHLFLNALNAYGAVHSGLEGVIVRNEHEQGGTGYEEEVARFASVVHRLVDPPPHRTSDEFFDFMLIPDALGRANDARQRWEDVEDWLARLKIGGLAIATLRYRPDGDLVSSATAGDAPVLSRNEIGQWVLRLIGGNYSVAPMAFAPVSDLVTDSRGLAGFILIVQRL